MKFSIRVLYKKLSRKREFHGHMLSDSHTLLMGVHGFYTYFPYFLTDFSETQYKSPHNTAEKVVKISVVKAMLDLRA
jgi:hypothetical protein